MNEAVPDHSAGGAADSAKLAAAVVLLLGGIVAFYALHAQPDWQRWLAVVAGVVLGIVVFGLSQRGRSFFEFVIESRVELRKVVWPEREETIKTTYVVFIFAIVMGVFFWLLDMALTYMTRLLGGQAG